MILHSLTAGLKNIESYFGFRNEVKWRTVIFLFGLHIFAFCWCFLYAFPVKWQTVVFAMSMYMISGTGLTCGAHRLWTHRTYKAKLPLKIVLMLCYSCVGQNSIYNWVRIHRTHHKFSDSDADPHNVRRGFFFAHVGWVMMKANKQVIERGREVDMSDIEADPLLRFERRYSIYLGIIFCHILPTITNILLWGESWKCAVAWQNFIRFLAVLHSEWSVNSFSHIIGYKPYDKNICPAENHFVSIITWGEGWHNYHHTFPYDYKASEEMIFFNISALLIKFWSLLGLSYDLKEASLDAVMDVKRKRRKKKEVDKKGLEYQDNTSK